MARSAVVASLGLVGCNGADDLIATLKATGGASAQSTGGASQAGVSQGGEPPVQVPTESLCALADGAPAALARYDFEDPQGAASLRDSQGLKDAQMMGGAFAPVPGPEGCGQALSFGDAGSFALVPNLPSWDLEVGSIDFWFQVPDAPASAYGILGRDRSGTDLPGHFSVWLASDRTVTARLQGATLHATHCSEVPLPLGLWAHVGFNFGAPGSELWVNGTLAARAGDPRVETIVPACGGTTTDGLAGNEQPWVLGFDTSRSGDALDGFLWHFDGGAIDALQISAVRRDFRAP